VQDKRIGLDSAIAAWAWVTAAVLNIIMWFTSDVRFGHTAIFVVAIAATATIRRFIVQECLSLRNAFDLGRDYAEHRVRTMPRR